MDVSLERRRALRRLATEPEKRVWHLLRGRQFSGLKFRRQHPVGPYILDFYCAHHRLAVELDGGQHFTVEGEAYDKSRSAFLASQGIRVIRFTNSEVFEEIDGVAEAIERSTSGDAPHPVLLPADAGRRDP